MYDIPLLAAFVFMAVCAGISAFFCANMRRRLDEQAKTLQALREQYTNITHEMRTPISVILGAVQLIEQKMSRASPEDSSTLKHFHTIRQNCYRLIRLVNNILDMARAFSGYAVLNEVNCNIVSLVEKITQSVIPFAVQKQLCLKFSSDCKERTTAVDLDKVERIVLNLLSNAIKFTPPGGHIEVCVGGNTDSIWLSVRDDGPGIPANKQKEIFERFRQAGERGIPGTHAQGSGIGLSLVKSFVELHGGNISVRSETGKGSEFTVHLPIKRVEERNEKVILPESRQEKVIEAVNIEFSDIYGPDIPAKRPANAKQPAHTL